MKRLVRATVPLRVRLAFARFLGRQAWLPHRYWWIEELLRDFAARDPNAYHRFLWTHHVGHAETYEVKLRFGADRLHPSRRLLFEDLTTCLAGLSVRPDAIASVLEVGCSLGYNLRYLETRVFRAADVLEGCDIDAYAVAQGNGHLQREKSRARLWVGDLEDLGRHLDARVYDVILCAGVLMYLERKAAERAVASIVRHTRVLAAFAGLADPERDNRSLTESRVRTTDGTFIHNLDDMVLRSGGRVIQRRWEGARQVAGNSVYFVFVAPRPR